MGGITPSNRECTISRAFKDSEVRLAFLQEQSLDQQVRFIFWKFMASVVQKLQFLQFEIHWTHLSLSYPERLDAS